MNDRLPAQGQKVLQRLGEAAAVLPDLLKLAWRLTKDPRVPLKRRLVAGAALGYIVLPVDIIPDAIPGLGQADDLLIVALALRLLMDGAGPEIVDEHWDGSPEALELVDTVVGWGANLVPGRLRRSLRRLTG